MQVTESYMRILSHVDPHVFLIVQQDGDRGWRLGEVLDATTCELIRSSISCSLYLSMEAIFTCGMTFFAVRLYTCDKLQCKISATFFGVNSRMDVDFAGVELSGPRKQDRCLARTPFR